ncbi:hypothetical protein BP00DRAFT_254846 [Aspergillus indologenus CBS 114.80]|uniref:Uncharacterized protein n=1 Tax=Aspergillus indologenus CBS 114.80 TaxID=1450541 RepID=A0A2V5I3W2_9EURO|nr:hypothetical protein BP00DRAFT_254846 [Aspergillus indologenus CBS 114.80]
MHGDRVYSTCHCIGHSQGAGPPEETGKRPVSTLVLLFVVNAASSTAESPLIYSRVQEVEVLFIFYLFPFFFLCDKLAGRSIMMPPEAGT